ncbi:aldehyde dehydrogenase family protein [Hyphomonas sp. NPDC076900]|uniref:aldehyde dehydrogenase family protein n=1 Tax=unclassified Hyphomonas TaxID=2630699 RepID=UPI003D07DD8D
MSLSIGPFPDAGANPQESARQWINLIGTANLAGGKLLPASGALSVLNPATLETLGLAAASDAGDVACAVEAAHAARGQWAHTPARERGRLIAEAGRLIREHAETLSVLLAMETGKALRTECRGELSVASDLAIFYGGLGSELKGQTIPFDPAVLAVTMREPLGVVAAILPWNVPLVLMMLKIAPALVAGNTVVVKASEEAPFATIAACLLMNSLLPPGVVNVVCGTGTACGAALCDHEHVAKITFTGSEAAGELVYQAGARRIIPVSLELGGKSPMIVCDDADVEKAVKGAVNGMRFTRQGQSCTAASRIYVHNTIFTRFVEDLKLSLDRLVIGDPLNEAVDIGTVISEKQIATISRYVEIAEATEGVEIIRCSHLPTARHLSPKLFMQPTLVIDPPPNSPLVQEEIFGPVTCIIPWTDYEQVIEAANSTHYGLAATVWTNSLAIALDATRRINAGYVQVNQNLTIQPNLSYGGFGRSGLGREASLEAMVEHFTRSKTIAISMS